MPTKNSRTLNSSTNGVRNALLQRLRRADFDQFRKQMDEVPLDFKQTLYEQDGPIGHVYFPNTCLISMVTVLHDDGVTIETGVVGYEGVVGVPAAFLGGKSPGQVLCQIPGEALRLPSSVIVREQRRGGSPLIKLIHAYLNFVIAMLGQNAACNRMHTVEERMARWLLMTQDRVGQDQFPLTQQFLGQMLGVHRPTVNLAGSVLQRAGFIRYTRGRITITNRHQLEGAACECYAHLKKQLEVSMAAGAR